MIVIPLCLLLFGIITFGLVMGFKQNMVQAASEGARAGAVATSNALALTNAQLATEDAVRGFGKECGVEGLTCSYSTAASASSVGTCIFVSVEYDYANYPFVDIPLVGAFIPDDFSAESSMQVNP